jgi:hypothetical protein
MGATGALRAYGEDGAMLCPGALYGEPGIGPRVTAGTICVSLTADSGYMFLGGLMCRNCGSFVGCGRLFEFNLE